MSILKLSFCLQWGFEISKQATSSEKISIHSKKNETEDQILKEKSIRMSKSRGLPENWMFLGLLQLLKASTEEEELF